MSGAVRRSFTDPVIEGDFPGHVAEIRLVDEEGWRVATWRECDADGFWYWFDENGSGWDQSVTEVRPVLGRSIAEVRVTDPDTGGQKGQKPERYGLIPVWPLAEVARVYGYGASKYEPNNWRRGYAWTLSFDALNRHIQAFWAGEETDPESGLHHLAHAAFHLFALMHYSREGVGTDDRTN